MTLVTGGSWSRQIHRGRRQKGGRQGLWGARSGELLANGDGAQARWKHSGDGWCDRGHDVKALLPPNSALKNGQFYVVYILSQLLKKRILKGKGNWRPCSHLVLSGPIQSGVSLTFHFPSK